VTADELVTIITVHPLRRIALLAACQIHVLHLQLPTLRLRRLRAPGLEWRKHDRSLGKERVHESDVKVNRSSGSLLYLIARCSFGHFNYHKTGICDVEHAEIRNDAVNDPCACERKRALAQELGAAVGGSVLHEHQNTSNAGH
jgi:hypothetical protein